MYLRRFKHTVLTYGESPGVTPEAFQCDEDDDDGLSLFAQVKALDEPVGRLHLQRQGQLPGSGDFPGVARVDLGEMIAKNQIQPTRDELDSEPLGRYHYTIPCPDEELQSQLAHLARIDLYPLKGEYGVACLEPIEALLERHPRGNYGNRKSSTS